MAENGRKTVVVGIAGASGVAYAQGLLKGLLAADREVHVIVSDVGRRILAEELGLKIAPAAVMIREMVGTIPERVGSGARGLKVHEVSNVGASVASGSFPVEAMVIVPCSTGTMARIANGLSTNLLDRVADVTLKERRRLVLVVRETPLSLIQLENMASLTRAGATVMPASPGFYLQPTSVADLIDFMVARILDHLEIPHKILPRWTGRVPRSRGGILREEETSS